MTLMVNKKEERKKDEREGTRKKGQNGEKERKRELKGWVNLLSLNLFIRSSSTFGWSFLPLEGVLIRGDTHVVTSLSDAPLVSAIPQYGQPNLLLFFLFSSFLLFFPFFLFLKKLM